MPHGSNVNFVWARNTSLENTGSNTDAARDARPACTVCWVNGNTGQRTPLLGPLVHASPHSSSVSSRGPAIVDANSTRLRLGSSCVPLREPRGARCALAAAAAADACVAAAVAPSAAAAEPGVRPKPPGAADLLPLVEASSWPVRMQACSHMTRLGR
eukprot:1159239-Pelagomonas_calceolata.AAC.10